MLSGRTALVTGAGKGIGKAIALTLANYGADVAINYCGSEEKARETAEEIIAMGRKAILVKANVANSQEVAQMFQTVTEEFGKLDILVNNAGITRDNLAVRMSEEEFE